MKQKSRPLNKQSSKNRCVKFGMHVNGANAIDLFFTSGTEINTASNESFTKVNS